VDEAEVGCVIHGVKINDTDIAEMEEVLNHDGRICSCRNDSDFLNELDDADFDKIKEVVKRHGGGIWCCYIVKRERVGDLAGVD
jgi:hypothetical protein